MNAILSPDVLTDSAIAAKLTDSEWVALHAPRFSKSRSAYKIYETFLREVLQQICKRLAPISVVEVRAKTLPSLAEKILRKRRDYQDSKDPLPPDPLVRLTDLCGGRVVTQTAEEVRTICRFIESAFEIDWPNSEDVSQRLKPTEFGYRSVHYIVQIDPAKLKAAGINGDVPTELLGFSPNVLGPQAAGRPLKAEIQVRTLLEHAAAALGHDTLYKTELKVPDRIKRHHATLAAMLESVDTGFGQMLASLKEYQSSLGAYYDRGVVVEEIARLRIVLDCDPTNVSLAVRIARHALAIGQHEAAETVLEPFVDEAHFGVQRTLGQALTEMCWDKKSSRKFRKGQALLRAACAHPPQDSETLCLLAETIARDDDHGARKLFHEAIQADATEPFTLARYLEFETAHLGNDNAVRLSTPMIRNAMERCFKQIEAGVNLPAAWSSLAFFHLLVGESIEALNAIAQVGTLCQGHGKQSGECGMSGRPCAAGRALKRFRKSLRRLRGIREKIKGYDWCERTVLLLLAVRIADEKAVEELRGLVSWNAGKAHFSPKDSIVIMAGACVSEMQEQLDALSPHLLRGCGGLSFKLLCGGTRSGISRLAGDVAEKSAGTIRGFGYLPRYLPRGVKEDENTRRFAKRLSSEGKDFTPLDPLQGWTDLVAAGVSAAKVKVLAYAGGMITNAECAIALALGARVGVVDNPALPKDRQFLDPAWQGHPNLVRLPMDAMTIRAFLLVDELPLGEAQQKRLEKAARKAHEEYLASATPKDPSHQKWEELTPSLKLSNYHQVAYWEQMLKQHGLCIRPLTDEDRTHDPIKLEELIGEAGIQLLAEMEHGRWNVERLLRGWRHSQSKDIANKLNPCLVPWLALKNVDGKDFQPYDLKAIQGLPAKLREAGLELVKSSTGAGVS